MARGSFEAGAVWASEQAEATPEAVCDHGCTEITGLCLVDHTLTPASEQPDREPSDIRSHVRDLTGETDEGLTELGGFRGERHDSTETGSVAPPSDTDLVSVSWFDCDCGFSKPCAESHLKRARVPRALLAAQEVRHVS